MIKIAKIKKGPVEILCDYLPRELIQKLSRNNIKIHSIISYNQGKGRWCIEGRSSKGQKLLIKWNEESNSKSVACLMKEKNIYRRLSSRNYLAEFIDYDEILVLRFLDCYKTARKSLKNDDLTNNHFALIKGMLSAWMDFISDSACLSEFCSSKPPQYKDEINKYLFTLMLSGPMDARRRPLQSLRNFVIYHVIKCRQIKEVLQPEVQVIHGDFHLNNVLCNEKGDYFALLDFENVTYGYRVLELAFFYAQVWRLKCGDRQLFYDLDKFINREILKDKVERELFWKAAKLYKIGVSFNRKFL